MSYNNVKASQYGTIIVNGYATEGITEESFAKWANDLTYVSYYSYGYKMNGDLVTIDDEELIQNAFDLGVAPLMVISPFNELGEYSYDLLKVVFTDPAMRDRLINHIVLTVIEKNYYGVVFNFGYIATEDRDQFVITISKAAARLNQSNALAIVSLLPGVNDAGIDYISLGKAANFIELRTFQSEQIYEPPMAIFHIERVREMLTSIVNSIGSDKIFLGLPNYGYDWTLPYVRGESVAEMITHVEAVERAGSVGAMIEYNVNAQSPYYQYTDDVGLRHEVWFDDARSMRAKLEIVNQFKLAGISIWTIMNPFPVGVEMLNQLYDVYKVVLPFIII